MRKVVKKHKKCHWFSLILCGLILYFSFSLISQQTRLHQIKAEQANAEARLAAARSEHEALLQERENLHRPEYIEKIAREELGMAREGELPYYSGRK